jgi:hypothetical protein
LTIHRSRFRPRLDDPGPWQAWELDQKERQLVGDALHSAADETADRLHSLFGQIGSSFGAAALARSLAAAPFDHDHAFALAKAVTALDYHWYRATPPNPRPGGLTNSTNRKVWERLRPHLFDRLLALIASDVWQSLLWRAVFERIPESWLPVTLIEQALENNLVRFGPYKSVEVDLELSSTSSGGLEWIRENVKQSIEFIERALRKRRPVLIELVRSAASSPLSTQTLVVYCAEKTESGDLRMLCYDTGDARHVVRIDAVTGEEVLRIEDSNDDTGRATIKALRVCSIDPARPPLFGARRYLDRWLPWKLFWSLKRRFVLLFERRRDVVVEGVAGE